MLKTIQNFAAIMPESNELKSLVQEASKFACQVEHMDLKAGFIAACIPLRELPADELQGQIEALAAKFPISDGSSIVLNAADDVAGLVGSYKIVTDFFCKGFAQPPAVRVVAANLISRVVASPEAQESCKDWLPCVAAMIEIVAWNRLQSQADAYSQLGNDVEDRVKADPALTITRALINARQAVPPPPECLADVQGGHAPCQALLTQTDSFITTHGVTHITRAQEPVSKAKSGLQPLCGGRLGGGSWKERLKCELLWLELKAIGEASVASINSDQLRLKIHELHKAHKVLKARINFFGLSPDLADDETILPLLKEARATLVEHHCMRACIMAASDMEAAKTLINQQVRGFEMASIKIEDLQPALWLCCTLVTSGQRLETSVP